MNYEKDRRTKLLLSLFFGLLIITIVFYFQNYTSRSKNDTVVMYSPKTKEEYQALVVKATQEKYPDIKKTTTTPPENPTQMPDLRDSPSPTPSKKLKVKPTPPSTPSPTPSTRFLRTTQSRLYAYYFVNRKEYLKVDLFYDLNLESVRTFVKLILNCRHQKSNFDQRVSFLKIIKSDLNLNLNADYKKFLAVHMAAKDEIDDVFLVIDKVENISHEVNVIGEILDMKTDEFIVDSKSNVSTPKFSCNDILFTTKVEDGLEENENLEFQTALSFLKSS